MALPRFSTVLISVLSLIGLFVGAALAAEQQHGFAVPSQMEEVVYPICDLAIPLSEGVNGSVDRLEIMRRLGECAHWLEATGDLPPKPTSRTMSEFLIRLITQTISPESWKENGGAGTIEYSPRDWKLVVTQTQHNQRRIAALLESIEKVLAVEVAVQIRLVSVSREMADSFVNIVDLPQSGIAFLNDRQLKGWLEHWQGNRTTNVMQAPKVTSCNGHRFSINVGDCISAEGIREQFLAAQNAPAKSGAERISITPFADCCTHTVSSPVGHTVDFGVFTSLLPIVSADRRFVQLKLDLNMSNLKLTDPSGPKVEKLTVNQTVVIPDQGTVVIRTCKTLTEARREFGPPILSSIPYINRLFTTIGYAAEEQELFVFVTTRVILPTIEPRAIKIAAAK